MGLGLMTTAILPTGAGALSLSRQTGTVCDLAL